MHRNNNRPSQVERVPLEAPVSGATSLRKPSLATIHDNDRRSVVSWSECAAHFNVRRDTSAKSSIARRKSSILSFSFTLGNRRNTNESLQSTRRISPPFEENMADISYGSLKRHMVIPKLEPNDRFLPHSSLEKLVTEVSVTDALEQEQENNPMDIPKLVAFICGKNGAKKIFAILVWTEQISLIKWFYENGVVDDMLPIYEDPEDYVYKTLGGRHSNKDAIQRLIKTSRWSAQRIDAFCNHDQWQFLVPVFRESQFKYSFDIQCRMPFLRKQTDPKDSLFSTVEQICIHKAHLEPGSNTVSVYVMASRNLHCHWRRTS